MKRHSGAPLGHFLFFDFSVNKVVVEFDTLHREEAQGVVFHTVT